MFVVSNYSLVIVDLFYLLIFKNLFADTLQLESTVMSGSFPDGIYDMTSLGKTFVCLHADT